MGLSSSQARLLSLTGRMHDIEYKAAKLEAQKLQMANKSRRVYEDYLNALDAAKIQQFFISNNGFTTPKDINLKLLETNRMAGLANSFYLTEIDSNKIYITQGFANKYNLDGTGEIGDEISFMYNAGFESAIVGFDTISNSAPAIVYSGVETTISDITSRTVPVTPPNVGYQGVEYPSVPNNAVSISSISATDNFDPSKTYTISNEAELTKLLTMVNTNGKSTQGVNFVLSGDIYMTSTNWAGIGTTSNMFQGIFDGNGYTIYGLTGSNGLFGNVKGNQGTVTDVHSITPATYGVIKNVCVEGANVSSSTNNRALIAGYANHAYIENVSASGNVSGTSWIAGITGQNEYSVIKYATSSANVSATSTCIGGLIGHDTSGTVANCLATGSVYSSSGYVGGLIGHEHNGGSGQIYSCSANNTSVDAASNKGAFIGVVDNGCTAIITDSKYNSDCGVTNAIGSGANHVTSANSGEEALVASATKTVTTTNVTLPTKSSVISNITMAVDKAGVSTPSNFNTLINQWLYPLYKESVLNDGTLVDNALKLASINDYLNEYLSNGSNADIVSLLVNDITNKTLSSTNRYQDHYIQSQEYEYTAYLAQSNGTADKALTITVGSVDNIANNIYTALRNNGHSNEFKYSGDVVNLQNWLNTVAAADPSNLNLAEINNYITGILNGSITDTTELERIYSAFSNNQNYTYPNGVYIQNVTSYNITLSNQEQNYESDWDMTDADVVDALNAYKTLKNGYIIVDDNLATSNEWLTNMINGGSAIFNQIDFKNNRVFETSVSTNTALQEVPDETLIRKAEAKYEAEMKKIDLKDRKYDTDLAALDAERNAIKQEIETLKTVAKDNVERTFKLFS